MEGYMKLARKNLLFILMTFLLVLSMAILYGCTEEKDAESFVTSGNGTIVENIDDEGVVTCTAVADEWNVFMGWYDGMEKYSDKATITVNKKTPDGLVAKFLSSGTLSADRILNGAYHRYGEFLQNQGGYVNYSYDTTISMQSPLINREFDVERGGYIDLNGGGLHDFAVVKEGQEVVLSQYYIDDAENAMLYIDSDGRKITAEDFVSIGSKVLKLPEIEASVWKLQNILDGNAFSQLDGYIGFRNAVGFIGSVENSSTQTKLSLKVDSLLNELKDRIALIDDKDLQWLKDIVETLSSQYVGINNKLPQIDCEIVVDYQKNDNVETINSITFQAYFAESYHFSFDGKLFTVPAGTISCKIENANVVLSQTPNGVPSEIISAFPEAVHALNFHADATLSFLKQTNVVTSQLSLIDEYSVNFDADINARAVLDAIDKDGELQLDKIDWDELGFLSLKISLIENPNDQNQASRHNGSTEYLNLLIDTKEYGAKAFVYIDLFNPKTTATSKYIINASYDIEKLVEVVPDIVEGLQEDADATAQSTSDMTNDLEVANLLTTTLKSAISLSNDTLSTDEILFEVVLSLLTKIAPDNEIIKNGLSYTSEFGSTLAIDEVKDLIQEEFSSTDKILSSIGNNLFGTTTSHVALKAGNLVYGCVIKNQDNKYVDQEGNVFVDEYNDAHKTLVGVATDGKVAGIDDATFTKTALENEVKALQGKSVTINNALFSDGSTSSTFENCQGNQATIAMKVYRAEYQIVDENTAQITVYMTFSAGLLQSMLLGTFDIPYGLIEYTTNVTLN